MIGASSILNFETLSLAPFTLALKPVLNRFTFKPVINQFTFKPVWPNHTIMWFTESGFQSTLGAFTQLP